MFDKVIFYNHWGAGDIFNSREFVREMIIKLPAEFYQYSHNKYPEILKDFIGLGWFPLNSDLEMSRGVRFKENHWLINTWIGRDGKYVMPGVGCFVEKNYEMYNDMFRELGISPLDKPVYEYLPTVDWSCFDLDQVNKFVKGHENNVLVCSGPVNSCQALNFDFAPIVELLCQRNPKIDFITTTGMPFQQSNLYSTTEIIRTYSPDLNEISYLSKFCKLIVGRNSGPFTCCQNRDNWLDPNKTFLSYTIEESAATFVQTRELPAKVKWSNDISVMGIVNKVEECLYG